ncbi:hypothetical protein FJU30_06270 [Affinibrenneria salicis]|uniref:Uncharacterized protein n=1 Tax=Affinibrenneria salicis TaxID=2590031 RepID=A0A5J5G4T4_9GAMM|nr:hypothetical protein [Affinibrenneria salicis]KAA9001885.1 hypothetical protein FJU30_06270 [Affinibrenneria salicis]
MDLSCRLVQGFTMPPGENLSALMPFVGEIVFAFDSSANDADAQLSGELTQTVKLWYRALLRKRIQTMRLMLPVNQRVEAPFLNGFRQGIYTSFADRATLWQANWRYDSVAKNWRVHYQQMNWSPPTMDCYEYYDNADAFYTLLTQLNKLALAIGGHDNFAHIFQRARQMLEYPASGNTHRRRMIAVAKSAWVLGGMGSWNDIAPWAAQQIGRVSEYETLTSDLFKHIQIALMYGANAPSSRPPA